MESRYENRMLVLIVLLSMGWERVYSQEGFTSIACGRNSSYLDPSTGILWEPDNNFNGNLGIAAVLPQEQINAINGNLYGQLRYFPDGLKNCLTLNATLGMVYLLRGTFFYGNYDKKERHPEFHVAVDATVLFRITGEIPIPAVPIVYEVVLRARSENLAYCMVAIPNGGVTFISTLELRLLPNETYSYIDSSNFLITLQRKDSGNNLTSYRYPVDNFDRMWTPDYQAGRNVKWNLTLTTQADMTPEQVLRTAVLGNARDSPLNYIIISQYDMSSFYTYMYFLELDPAVGPGDRVFNIYVNDAAVKENFDIFSATGFLKEVTVEFKSPPAKMLNISLVPTSNSRYAPLLNGIEVYCIVASASPTLEQDVKALWTFQNAFKLEHWSGDPCAPLHIEWDGVTCAWIQNFSTIVHLNLSQRHLQGVIPSSINNLLNLEELLLDGNLLSGNIPDLHLLKQLRRLELQNNILNGNIPSYLGLLPNLELLYLQNNNFSGTLPDVLLLKRNFTFMFSGNKFLQLNTNYLKKRRYKILVRCVQGLLIVSLVALIAVLACLLYKRRRKFLLLAADDILKHQHPTYLASIPVSDKHSIHVLKYSSEEMRAATENYKTMIGEGGFGVVYRGTLSNGQMVAVKVRSKTSIQGIREFTTELNLLSGIQHENLVPLLGFCSDDEHQMLVYPFISNGSLQDRLYENVSQSKPLDWSTRISIALGAARGLHYLHTGLQRCIIHRDVKSSNILLDQSMVAKVADFGFSKYAPQEDDSLVSLEVRGTAGYLDPEYYLTQQLTAKSDVFSFGVVLLELICGREPLNIKRPRSEWSLVEWVRPFIQDTNIESIVDPAIRSNYTSEALWRVIEVAICCVEPHGSHRPSMADVVRELEDALIIENNASLYMASIESNGSLCFSYIDDRVRPTIPSSSHVVRVYSENKGFFRKM